MKCLDLKGRTCKINLSKYCRESKGSKGHEKCRSLLKTVFGTVIICEEIPIPNSRMKIDFFIPELNLAVEVDGKQHEEYTPFFHEDKRDFYKAQGRDFKKDRWCSINEITLIRLKPNDDWEEVFRGFLQEFGEL